MLSDTVPGGHGHDSRQARERVVVALAGGPEGQMLIRRAARMARVIHGSSGTDVHIITRVAHGIP